MKIDTFAAMLSDMTKLDPEAILKAGGCIVSFANCQPITIEWLTDSETLCFYAKVIDLPQCNKEMMYQFLLQAHLFGVATQDSYFGIHKENNAILLFRSFSTAPLYDLDCFVALAAFKEQVMRWTKLLHSKYIITSSTPVKSASY